MTASSPEIAEEWRLLKELQWNFDGGREGGCTLERRVSAFYVPSRKFLLRHLLRTLPPSKAHRKPYCRTPSRTFSKAVSRTLLRTVLSKACCRTTPLVPTLFSVYACVCVCVCVCMCVFVLLCLRLRQSGHKNAGCALFGCVQACFCPQLPGLTSLLRSQPRCPVCGPKLPRINA